MQLKFKNEHIFFAIESIWTNLDYRFKFQVNQLITANGYEDFIQTIEVPEDILLQIFKAVSSQPEGVAAFINKAMLAELLPQIEVDSNLQKVQDGKEQPNESARLLIAINEINNANKATKAAKILNGKTQILS